MTKHGKPLSYMDGKKAVKKMITKKKAVKICDEAFSLYIRERDNYTCHCGKNRQTATIQCGHLITRSSHSVRWNEANAHAQCSGCNYSHEYHPEAFTSWWIGQYGFDAYERLVIKSKTTAKFSINDLLVLAENFKQRTEELKNG